MLTSVSGGKVGAAHVEEGVAGVGVGEEGLGEIRGLWVELPRQLAVVGTSRGAGNVAAQAPAPTPGVWRRVRVCRRLGHGDRVSRAVAGCYL